MLVINNKALKISNKWLNPIASPTPPTYYYVTTSGTNGTVLATPASGITGTEVTLSNTPDTGYEFDSYTITGATLKNTNQFDIGNSDVSVVGNFVASGPSFDEVTIGTQTWMASNLAIDDGGEGITIKDNVTANGVNFGTQYYYSRAAAIRVANSITGWHLPSASEWSTLASYIGTSVAGTKLKSTSGWNNSGNGTDDYGFTGLPVGTVYNGTSYSVGEYADFHTSEMLNSAYMIATLECGQPYLSIFDYSWDDLMSVRLIKDT